MFIKLTHIEEDDVRSTVLIDSDNIREVDGFSSGKGCLVYLKETSIDRRRGFIEVAETPEEIFNMLNKTETST